MVDKSGQDAEGRNVWQFLADASASREGREYALYFDGGGNPAHLESFARDGSKVAIEPGELIYAVDDWRNYNLKEGTLATILYQIEMGENGKIGAVGIVDVEYDVSVNITDDPEEKIVLEYQLTAESRDELISEGFNKNFPSFFKDDVTDAVLPDSVMRDAEGKIEQVLNSFITNMPFPPFHPTTASSVARAAIDETRPPAGMDGRASYAFNAAVRGEPENPQISKRDFEEALEEFTIDLTDLARKGALRPTAGREKEIKDIALNMTLTEDASVCLIGERGVGKTTVVHGLAQLLVSEDCPPQLRNARLLQVNLGDTQASKDAMWRGNVEEKIKTLHTGNAERHGQLNGQTLIYYYDDLTEHTKPTSAIDQMKRMLGTPGVKALATTTVEQFDSKIRKVDEGLARRLKEKIIGPAPFPAIVQMLDASWPAIRDGHGLRDMPEEERHDFYAFTDRLGSPLSQPQRGRRALDLAGAHARLNKRYTIEQEDKIFALADISGRTPESLSSSDYERLLKLGEALKTEVIGQDGLDAVALQLAGSRGGLMATNKPMGTFLFVGPSGVGKTETAKQIAKHFFGDENAFARLDMAEYQEAHSVSRMVGAPPGYVGYTDGKSALHDPVRNRPGGLVVLLDEIEKAHPDCAKVLLAIFDEGKAKDNHERTVDYTNVVFVLTSNLGASELAHAAKKVSIGFGNDTSEKRAAQESKIVDNAVSKFFLNEFMGRMETQGGKINFKGLQREHISVLAQRQIETATKRLAGPPHSIKNVKIELSPAAFDQIVTEGYDPVLNARPLIGAVNKRLNGPLGLWLLNPANSDKVKAFAQEHGGARIVIDEFARDLKPRLEVPEAIKPVVVLADEPTANDNAGAARALLKMDM